MKKENIDKLYQKELKDFSEIPDKRVWKAISASLDKKEKSKRVIPIWWKLGGAAALLVLSFLVFSPILENEIGGEKITNVGKTIKNSKNTDNTRDSDKSSDAKSTSPSIESSANDENINAFEKIQKEIINEGVVSNNEKELKRDSSTYIQNQNALSSSNVDVNKEGTKDLPRRDQTQRSPKQKSLVVNNISNERVNVKGSKANEPRSLTLSESAIQKNSNASIVQNKVNKEIQEKDSLKPDNRKSIFDEIEKNEELALVEESVQEKWEVGPSIGPVYFNSFGTGSPIHSNFAPNPKSGNINLSYGIGVAYKVGKRIKIRSGLNKVDYSYNTNDIAFSASLTASTNAQIENINYIPTSQNLVVRNVQESRLIQQTNSLEIAAPNPTREGTMVQDFGYLELPLEMNYAIIDKKFGFNIIGGFSSLFLVNNAVVLQSGAGEMEMGEANNLNDVNLSTNFGLGFNYKFTSKIQLSLEPMFKYQLNTFSQTAGTFQPFSIGVFTGLNFRL